MQPKKIFLYTSFILLGLFCLIVFSWWQDSTNFPDPDAFYHMKMAKLISQKGIITDFPWMQYTVLKDYYIDQHLLYHIILIPFVVWLPTLIGTKVSIIVLASSFIIFFSYVLYKLKIKGAAFWGLVVAITVPFTFRINLVKANSLSLIILFAGLYFAYRRKYFWLAIISFLYVWTYGGFALLPALVGLMAMIEAMYSHRIKENIYLFLSTVLGTVLGLVINPYFPKNLLFYWQQLVQIGIINYQSKIGVGGEWYPYGLVDLITGCSVVTIFVFIGLVIFIIYFKKLNKLNWFSFFLFILGTIVVLKSRRYIEYYVPFSVFFAAISFNTFIEISGINFWQKIKFFWSQYLIGKIIIFLSLVYLLLIIPAITVKDFLRNENDLRSGIPFNKFSASSAWLVENTPAGSIILHSDWDEFPDLFFYNSHNYYIVGLDPTFMYNYNQDLYWSWVNITIGEQKEDLPKIMKEQFNASYVFLEKDHTDMDSNMQQFKSLELVYEDDEAKIYKIKGED